MCTIALNTLEEYKDHSPYHNVIARVPCPPRADDNQSRKLIGMLWLVANSCLKLQSDIMYLLDMTSALSNSINLICILPCELINSELHDTYIF